MNTSKESDVNVEEKDNKSDSNVLSTFDDISLCDNNSSNEECNENCIQTNANDCNNGVEHNNELIINDKNEDNISMDSTPSEPLKCSSNDDKYEELSDSDIAEELKKKNGILFDLKLLENKYENKIISLQIERNDLQNQIEESKRIITESEINLKETKNRLTTNMDKVCKQNELTRKELESMVMKYATSEREVINLKKIREDHEKKLKDLIKDKESLLARIRGLTNEKTQLMASLDKKVVEISSLHRDYDKLKYELKERDLKWKQTQNKIKEELDAHNHTKTKLDSVSQSNHQLKEEAESLRKEVNNLLHKNDDNECDVKGNDTAINKMELLANDVENYKRKIAVYIQENHSLTTKIQTLERERLDHEQSVSKLKETVNELQLEISDHVSRLRDMEQLKLQLDGEKKLVSDLQNDCERLRNSNNELRAEMDSCRHKEGELLEFTERITIKSVQLQSEHNVLEQKSLVLKEEVEKLQKQCDSLNFENSSLNQTILQLKELHQKEVGILAKKLAEKTKLSDDLKIKVDELENEIRVNKRRHFTSVKELNKELFSMKKRLELSDSQTVSIHSDSMSMGSRTSSSNSLPDALTGNNHTNSSSNSSQASQQKTSVTQTSSTEQTNSLTPATAFLPEVDKQALIDRIIRLQKSLTKRNEKIDFLEEHNHHLTEEMKKKSKLVQHYILREETGALSTSSMDENKHKLAKRGTGIMSSLYNSAPNDSTMTLELSLEINRKLQAVLEDTILKNITLKENLNTLGTEIERISKQNDQKN